MIKVYGLKNIIEEVIKNKSYRYICYDVCYDQVSKTLRLEKDEFWYVDSEDNEHTVAWGYEPLSYDDIDENLEIKRLKIIIKQSIARIEKDSIVFC